MIKFKKLSLYFFCIIFIILFFTNQSDGMFPRHMFPKNQRPTKEKSDKYPLHYLAQYDNFEILRDYLIFCTQAEINQPDNNGNTPLHIAVLHGSIGGIYALLYAGAYIQAKNCDNLTPIELAQQLGNIRVINTLETFIPTNS
ncbi:ankyrin repeat domain-containing protein [Candidatus Babeliales bacterium]|nr:ankyrin repeat domain-containing protein [Candidatus Babeliales bacterium]MCF7899116.1 ankyrin repeat domain-containing protein [Candidatus Babeliales bacterium]